MPIDYKSYSIAALMRSIRKHEKRIAEHESKIKKPGNFVPDWDEQNSQYKKGLIAHWEREIKNFHEQIRQAKEELARRETL